MGSSCYDKDVFLWSREQAALLRAGNFSQLDIEHLADEIEDVGKSEKRELAGRMAVLLAHLLKWQYQPERRSSCWTDTINVQRQRILLRLKETPSLKAFMRDDDWMADAWLDGISSAQNETGLPMGMFPKKCPWSPEHLLSADWLPRSNSLQG